MPPKFPNLPPSPKVVRSHDNHPVPGIGQRVAAYRATREPATHGFDPHSTFSIRTVGEDGKLSSCVMCHAIQMELSVCRPLYEDDRALVTGYVVAYRETLRPHGWQQVNYRPSVGEFFMVDTGVSWLSSDAACLRDGKLWVTGHIETGKRVA